MFFQWLVCVLVEYLSTGNKLSLFKEVLVLVEKSLGSDQLLSAVSVYFSCLPVGKRGLSHFLCLYIALCFCFLQCFCQVWEKKEDVDLQGLLCPEVQRENLNEGIISWWLPQVFQWPAWRQFSWWTGNVLVNCELAGVPRQSTKIHIKH